MHREFALVPIMQKRATRGWRMSVTAAQSEFESIDYPRRRSCEWIFGQEFDSPRVHQKRKSLEKPVNTGDSGLFLVITRVCGVFESLFLPPLSLIEL